MSAVLAMIRDKLSSIAVSATAVGGNQVHEVNLKKPHGCHAESIVRRLKRDAGSGGRVGEAVAEDGGDVEQEGRLVVAEVVGDRLGHTEYTA